MAERFEVPGRFSQTDPRPDQPIGGSASSTGFVPILRSQLKSQLKSQAEEPSCNQVLDIYLVNPFFSAFGNPPACELREKIDQGEDCLDIDVGKVLSVIGGSPSEYLSGNSMLLTQPPLATASWSFIYSFLDARGHRQHAFAEYDTDGDERVCTIQDISRLARDLQQDAEVEVEDGEEKDADFVVHSVEINDISVAIENGLFVTPEDVDLLNRYEGEWVDLNGDRSGSNY